VTDTSANVTTKNYQTVIPAGSASAPIYDLDGNQTQDVSGNTYAWDAKNELVQITYPGGAKSQFSYDGLGRRVAIVETGSNGAITSTKQFVFDGFNPVEERDAGNNVTKRFFVQGEQIAGASYYYTIDHLGSIREMTSGSGVIQARYDYDPYGVMSIVGGVTLASDFQYAGYYKHAPSGLNLPTFRPYVSNFGRWPSRDPIGEDGGINLYDYVLNNPIDNQDPLGLWTLGYGGQASVAVAGGVVQVSSGLYIGHSAGSPWYGGWSIGGLFQVGAGLEAGMGLSAGIFVAGTNADCVSQLKGPGYSVGASANIPGVGPSVGIDRTGGDGYTGWTGSAGGSISPVPAEAHGLVTYTY